MVEAAVSEDGAPYTDRAQVFVAVAPAYRRQGVGGRLADEVDRFGAAAGVWWLETQTVEAELATTLPLRRGHGFVGLKRYHQPRRRPPAAHLDKLPSLRRPLVIQ